MAVSEDLTLGPVARHFGRPVWQIRRLFERGLLPPARRVGAYRVVPIDQLPLIEQALRAAGYLDADEKPEQGSATATTRGPE